MKGVAFITKISSCSAPAEFWERQGSFFRQVVVPQDTNVTAITAKSISLMIWERIIFPPLP